MEKLQKIERFASAVPELSEELFSSEWKVKDKHHIVYAGNPEAKIMVVQKNPDQSELCFAKMHNTHNNYVCTGPGGNLFRDMAKRKGYNVDSDFLYVNLIPYVPLGYGHYPLQAYEKAVWMFEELFSIVQPTVVVVLGYEAFVGCIQNEDVLHFEALVKSQQLHSIHGEGQEWYFIALEDPELVLGENHLKHKRFYSTLGKLHTTINQKIRKQ